MGIDIERRLDEHLHLFKSSKIMGLAVDGSDSAMVKMRDYLKLFVNEVYTLAYEQGIQDTKEQMGLVRDDGNEEEPIPDSHTIHPIDMRRSISLSILNSMLQSGAADSVSNDTLVNRSIAMADVLDYAVLNFPLMHPDKDQEKGFRDIAAERFPDEP